MNQRHVIVFAPRIHCGGGLVLLLEILRARRITAAVLDPRVRVPAESSIGELVTVRPGLASYLMSELALRRLAKISPDAVILCLSNLPPLFRLSNPVSVFVQNRFVLDDEHERGFSLKTRIRHTLERLIFNKAASSSHRYLVQSESMARLVKKKISDAKIQIVPFVDDGARVVGNGIAKKDLDFIYVASPEPHKNHATLLEAWMILSKQGNTPTLGLTLEKSDSLWLQAEKINREKGTKIIRLEPGGPEARREFFARARALIFPSLLESYGLPMIEAAQNGLPILASELDFVRDSVVPAETFDPRSAVSIARAVSRSLGQPAVPVAPLKTGEFLSQVLNP